jgi:hypothetical protein
MLRGKVVARLQNFSPTFATPRGVRSENNEELCESQLEAPELIITILVILMNCCREYFCLIKRLLSIYWGGGVMHNKLRDLETKAGSNYRTCQETRAGSTQAGESRATLWPKS